MSEPQYDSGVLAQYADQLYTQARWIIVSTAIKYGVKYGAGAFVLGFLLERFVLIFGSQADRGAVQSLGDVMLVGVIVITIMSLLLGAWEGEKKAFQLKLEAQRLLCQRQIEMNTRQANKAMTAAQG